MPREREGFRDQLESIIAAHPQGEKMAPGEVAEYLGSTRQWVTRNFPFLGKGRGKYITRTTLARELVK